MAIKQAPENKAVTAAPEPPAVGLLWNGEHGRRVCPVCGRLVATCGHLGHQGMEGPANAPCAECAS